MLVGIVASGSPSVFGGPRLKYEMISEELRRSGTEVVLSIPNVGGWRGAREAARVAGDPRADVVIVRAGPALVAAWPRLVMRRFRRQPVIVEVPTPAVAGFNELKATPLPWYRRLQALGMVAVTYPWLVMVGSRIVQYGEESRYFSLGLKHKMVLATNAINVDRFRCAPRRTQGPLRLLMIGAVSEWHGLDRVLRGMAQTDRVSVTTTLRVVGDGPASGHLKLLAASLGIQDRVEFVPSTHGPALDALCDDFDAGLGSLGAHRMGLTTLSPLKNREYMARGIPVIYAGNDLGLESARESGLVLQVSADDTPIDLQAIWAWAIRMRQPESHLGIRDYAKRNLNLETLVGTYLGSYADREGP